MFDPTDTDPQRFCKLAQVWERDSDLSGFPRLMREFTRGHLLCRVAGRTDRDGGLILALAIRGETEATCQRCLGSLKQELEIERDIYLARTESEIARLESRGDDTTDVILATARISLIDLIEDEVLLGVPLAPMHAPGTCIVPSKIN